MNYKVYGIATFLALMCISCQSIKINRTSMHTSVTNPIALGVIGIQKKDVLSSDYRVSAIPEYKEKIRVGVTASEFTTTTFDAYQKVSKDNAQQIKYVDSLESKPRFVTLKLLDRVATLSELQKEYNTTTISYLKSQKEATIVTSVSLALPTGMVEEIIASEAVFLSNSGYKQYHLSLINGGKVSKKISFDRTTIFGYELSFFCWSENDRKQIVLANIIDEKTSCSKNAYRDAQKALQKMNYFKL
ncbi:hypothetical protein [Aquimarina mytili]|uniref:Uncharacterized protein n=1 Tax=Aquimarina mytili TaxID=874423 RepID=A0A936ZRA4_9FLAO|nr:hypothetical protein [Aquimarina mytili]MBL0684194.1 hypothetical protein [Aquimarina mytili]